LTRWKRVDEEDHVDDQIPARNCDVVMKGGITSGVVYPLTITELAKEFRFKNVGGTSAGAIAAALTAAAEYARQNGSRSGFDRLEKLPAFLAGSTDGQPNLLNLFPPASSTRSLFSVLTAFLGDGSIVSKVARAIAALLVVSPLVTLISFVPALLLPLILWRGPIGPLALIGLALIELVLIAAAIGAMVMFNARRALGTTLPKNRFGFSTGRAPKGGKLPGVSEWLHDEIQATAGLSKTAPPLTFGDLWLAGEQQVDDAVRSKTLEKRHGVEAELRSINLQMITTALSHGHPYRLPFENRRFAFRPSELRDYFSDSVVDYLVSHAREDERVAAANDPDLMALPEPWDLPIVVAARMSLSFPILFSMVPLYAIDYTRPEVPGTPRAYERCWFIDGGLSSNFPTSLFDSAIPRWPTFGINLEAFPPDYPNDDVWMTTTASSGTSDHWLRFPAEGKGAFGGFVGAMLDSIRNWRDNTQLAVPGFRDRIVHVRLTPYEGGLNLNMSADKVKTLAARGERAGHRLRERFGAAGANSEGQNWNTHRWTRFRTAASLVQKLMHQIDRALTYRGAEVPSYDDLLKRKTNEKPKTDYWWKRSAADYEPRIDDLRTFAHHFAEGRPDFGEGAPGPQPELRISPRL
jgi:predicted acylesterase/phospholipase RssA